jgi:hypothetical protein
MAEASTAVAVVDPAAEQRRQAARVALVAGNTPRAIVPTDFEGAWRISQAVVAAKMTPKSLETVEKCAVAILHGLEVGLTPMNALQSIAVINGRPSLWGDGALGLIQASGLLEDQDEHYEGQEGTETFKAVCVLKRKGKTRPYIGEFSMLDARKAGLLAKDGPWQTYLKRMLKMRARAFAMRDGFSDVLKGLSVAEEQEDVERAKQPEPVDDGGGPPAPANDDGGGPPVPAGAATGGEVVDDGGEPPAPETIGLSAEPTGLQATVTVVDDFPGDRPMKPAADDLDIPDYLRRVPATETTPRSVDEQKWLDELEAAFTDCRDAGTLFEQNDELMQPKDGQVSIAAWNAACDILDRHIERLQTAE